MSTVNLQSIQKHLAEKLPNSQEWNVRGLHVTYDFARAQQPLRALSKDEVEGHIPADWAGYVVFGEETFRSGGVAHSALCIRVGNGAIYHLDVESDPPLSFLNTNHDKFVASFEAISSLVTRGTEDTSKLGTDLRTIDPEGYDRSDWRFLVDYLNEPVRD